MFMRESFDQFRLFCSGRKNCRGILFDFKVGSGLAGIIVLAEEASGSLLPSARLHYSCR